MCSFNILPSDYCSRFEKKLDCCCWICSHYHLNFIHQTREKEFSSAEKLHFSLLGILNERDHLPKHSQAHARLSFQLRNSLNQLYSEIQSLKGHLERLSQNKQLYELPSDNNEIGSFLKLVTQDCKRKRKTGSTS